MKTEKVKIVGIRNEDNTFNVKVKFKGVDVVNLYNITLAKVEPHFSFEYDPIDIVYLGFYKQNVHIASIEYENAEYSFHIESSYKEEVHTITFLDYVNRKNK